MIHKTTIKINIIYCTMEVSGYKYSMNDGTGVERTTLSSTLQMDWGREVDRNT